MVRTLLGLMTLLAMTAGSALAQTGNEAPSGAHYNLNIIGVENPKTSPLTSTSRRTIFVALGRTGQAQSNIYLTPGPFEVCDGNAFDAAHNCAGQPIGTSAGAVFQLPCNTNLPPSGGGIDLVPCRVNETAAYTVWIRALGKPGGGATMTTCAWDPDTLEEICSSENVILLRERGKQTFKNVTNELTSLVANIDDDVNLERVSLFGDNLQDWFWKYENRGLRLAQIRFYLQ